MSLKKTNIALIGMPGAGKSTVGVILAKQLSYGFVDTDLLIQTSQGRLLQDIVDSNGHFYLRQIEEDILVSLGLKDHVISTGGSAVYSEKAMSHLKSSSLAVFLKADLQTIAKRIEDPETRGLAKHPGQNLEDLFMERSELYEKHADVTIECSDLTQEETCSKVVEATVDFFR